MVTSKNSFRHLLSRKYPSSIVKVSTTYPIFVISEPLDEIDSRLYYFKALDNGLYWCTYIQDKEEVSRLYNAYIEGGISLLSTASRERDTLPTSYSAFNQWLNRHAITPTYKAFKRGSARSLLNLGNEDITNDTVLDTDHTTWVFYELSYEDGKSIQCKSCTHPTSCSGCAENLFNEKALSTLPHFVDHEHSLLYVLTKSSRSAYISKKQMLLNQLPKALDDDF